MYLYLVLYLYFCNELESDSTLGKPAVHFLRVSHFLFDRFRLQFSNDNTLFFNKSRACHTLFVKVSRFQAVTLLVPHIILAKYCWAGGCASNAYYGGWWRSPREKSGQQRGRKFPAANISGQTNADLDTCNARRNISDAHPPITETICLHAYEEPVCSKSFRIYNFRFQTYCLFVSECLSAW